MGYMQTEGKTLGWNGGRVSFRDLENSRTTSPGWNSRLSPSWEMWDHGRTCDPCGALLRGEFPPVHLSAAVSYDLPSPPVKINKILIILHWNCMDLYLSLFPFSSIFILIYIREKRICSRGFGLAHQRGIGLAAWRKKRASAHALTGAKEAPAVSRMLLSCCRIRWKGYSGVTTPPLPVLPFPACPFANAWFIKSRVPFYLRTLPVHVFETSSLKFQLWFIAISAYSVTCVCVCVCFVHLFVA